MVIVIGDVMVDKNYICASDRLAQEACIPIMNAKQETYSLGGASNVYSNLLSMGINTRLITVIGDDTDAHKFLELVEQSRTSFVNEYGYEPTNNIIIKDNTRCTTMKHRFYVNKKIVFRYDVEDTDAISQRHQQDLLYMFKTHYTPNCKIVILSDYDKGVLTRDIVEKIIKFSNKRGVKVLVDPKLKDILKYGGCFLVKPNKVEAEKICGDIITLSNLRTSSETICETIGCPICLMTLGEDGVVLYGDGKIWRCDTSHENVVDITGAGDVVLAGFTYFYIKTNDLVSSMKFGNYCGQLKVRNFGTYIVKPYDILRYEKKDDKLIKKNELIRIIETIKNAKKRIVFTNGCFDILHYGHLVLLEQAKSLGDVLLVALNSDTSIHQLKGGDRPINRQEHRIKQMNAIEYVDFIVVFDELTPVELLKLIQPDIIVKGGDYKDKQIAGCEYAKKTVILDYIEGFSTTGIVDKIGLN